MLLPLGTRQIHFDLLGPQDGPVMAAIQRGMKSSGFKGTLPNPHQERKVTNLHRNLANFLGQAGPRRLPPR